MSSRKLAMFYRYDFVRTCHSKLAEGDPGPSMIIVHSLDARNTVWV